MKVELALDRCCGYGNCLLHADDVFELDDATGVARLLVVDLPADRLPALRAAAADCPAAAISITEPGSAGTDDEGRSTAPRRHRSPMPARSRSTSTRDS